MARSRDGDIPHVDIITSVLHRYTIASFIFIICLDFVLRKALDNDKHLGLTTEN